MALASLSGEGKWREESNSLKENYTEGFVSPSALEHARRVLACRGGKGAETVMGESTKDPRSHIKRENGKVRRARGPSPKDEVIPLPMGHVSRPCHTGSWSFVHICV